MYPKNNFHSEFDHISRTLKNIRKFPSFGLFKCSQMFFQNEDLVRANNENTINCDFVQNFRTLKAKKLILRDVIRSEGWNGGTFWNLTQFVSVVFNHAYL